MLSSLSYYSCYTKDGRCHQSSKLYQAIDKSLDLSCNYTRLVSQRSKTKLAIQLCLRKLRMGARFPAGDSLLMCDSNCVCAPTGLRPLLRRQPTTPSSASEKQTLFHSVSHSSPITDFLFAKTTKILMLEIQCL